MALKDSLVSHWRLDETSGNRADSFGSNTLTDHNSTPGAAAVIAKGSSFTAASSQYHSVASNATLRTGDIDFTIGAWVKITDKSATRMIAAKWGGSGNYEYVLYYDNSADRFQFAVNTNGINQFIPVVANNLGSPSTSAFYYVQAGYDSVNDLLFINANAGTANTVSRAGGMFLGTSDFVIGRNDDGTTSYWNGLIDEVTLWKRKLSAAENTLIYNAGAGLSFDAWDSATIGIAPIRTGPPDPRAPWFSLARARTATAYSVPAPPAAQAAGTATPIPGTTFGPPIPGSPWFFRSMVRTGTRGTFNTPASTPAPPFSFGRGKQRPFIDRVPRRRKAPKDAAAEEQSRDEYEQRLSRFTEQVAERVNELVRRGQLVQTALGRWEVRSAMFSTDRAPAATDDVRSGFSVGQGWIDTAGQAAYVCIDSTANAAVWKAITS